MLALCASAPGRSATLPEQILDEPAALPSAETRASTAACSLGTGPLSGLSYTWTTPDAWASVAWRLPACPTCGDGIGLKNVSFRVRWLGACTAQVEVTVVRATGPPGCLVPDPSRVMCGPTLHSIVGTGSTGVVYTLPIPSTCCLDPGEEFFVRLRFIGLDQCYATETPSPGITTASTPCAACSQFFTTTETYPSITEQCLTGSMQFPFWVQVEMDCCTPVGVRDARGQETAAALSVVENTSRRIRLALDLPGTAARPVEVDVFDVAGRRARSLLRTELPGGRHLVDWDRKADSGARLGAGLYHVRLRSGEQRAVATVVLLD